MSLMHRALPLPIHAPILPDRYFCHSERTRTFLPVSPEGCRRAVDQNWPDGRTPIRYYMKDPRPSEGQWIPNHQESWPFCRVSIETAGPYEHLPHSVLLKPQELRGLAGYLIQKCAVENQGLGGFVTLGLDSALAYTHNPENEHWGGNFLTISIQSVPRWAEDTLEPGSRDRNIAALLSAYVASFIPARDSLHHLSWYHYAVSDKLRTRALEMDDKYNPNLTWWSKSGVWDWWAKRYNHTLHLWSPNDGPRPTTPLPIEWGNPSNESATNTSSSVNRPSGEDKGGGAGEGAGGEAEGDADSGAGNAQTDAGEGDDTDSSRTISAADTLMQLGGSGKDLLNDTIEAVDAKIGDMTYQCDDSLGNGLSAIDCEKLSWSGLKPPDSIETLQPGVPKFYFQGTCALGVSSLTPTTIIWAHLIAAFEALNMLCVQNPIKSVKGGRAYFGKQPVSSWINGKVKKDSIDNPINGTDALPLGINATIFKHNPKSQLACEWTLAEERKDISNCAIG